MQHGKILFSAILSVSLLALSAVDATAAQPACSASSALLASDGSIIATQVETGLGNILLNVLGTATLLSAVVLLLQTGRKINLAIARHDAETESASASAPSKREMTA